MSLFRMPDISLIDPLRNTWRRYGFNTLAAAAALCAVPISIAATESFLAIALMARIVCIVRSRTGTRLPRIFGWWLLWAILELLVWLITSVSRAGLGEIRHLLLIAAMFVVLPVLGSANIRLLVWRGLFVTASLSSIVLCCGFAERAIRFRHVTAAGDPAYYLRTGGLLHHWMIYAVVEVMIFGALLEFWSARPKDRKWLAFALAVNSLGIVFSLTRSLWLACFLLAGAQVASQRPRALWTLPLVALLAFLIAPAPLRQRVADSIDRHYYSNAERVQMWSVGWKMIRQHPLTGVGAGEVERLYPDFAPPGEPLPSYHGHLHNNALQLGSEFGLPVLGAAVLFTVMLARELARRLPDLYCRIGLKGLAGFLMIGMTDYTYGHSLGLILLAYTALSPLLQRTATQVSVFPRRNSQLVA